MHPRFFKLESVCMNHPRVCTGELARIAYALASEQAREKTEDPTDYRDGWAAVGAFCLAFDVRRYAIEHFGVPDDGTWGTPSETAAREKRKAPAQRRKPRKGKGHGGRS